MLLVYGQYLLDKLNSTVVVVSNKEKPKKIFWEETMYRRLLNRFFSEPPHLEIQA